MTRFWSEGSPLRKNFTDNFLHGEMEDYEIEVDRPVVHEFVTRVLELLEDTGCTK